MKNQSVNLECATTPENIIQIDDLKDGDCTVITDHGNFHGSYSDKFQCVFFAIPHNYVILGYIQ